MSCVEPGETGETRSPQDDDVDSLVQVPVGRRHRDPRITSQQAQARAFLEPAQHQQRLSARGRGALPRADVAVGVGAAGHPVLPERPRT